MKKCVKCKIEKELSEFYKQSAKKDGLMPYCKMCKKELNCGRAAASSRLKCRYGITLDDYDEMFIKQGKCCAICKVKEPGGPGRFHVDHLHSTGEVRGLLCNGCNLGLGHFKDHIGNLIGAAAYLTEHSDDYD